MRDSSENSTCPYSFFVKLISLMPWIESLCLERPSCLVFRRRLRTVLGCILRLIWAKNLLVAVQTPGSDYFPWQYMISLPPASFSPKYRRIVFFSGLISSKYSIFMARLSCLECSMCMMSSYTIFCVLHFYEGDNEGT